jgi:hypothetical protein
MLEMVEARRDGDRVEQRYDLFSGLLDAAQDKLDNGAALSEEELIGEYNIDYCIIEKAEKSVLTVFQGTCLSFSWLDMM